MNPWIAAALGAGAGALGYALSSRNTDPGVVYVAGSFEEADEITRVLYGSGLDPIRDFSRGAWRGNGVPNVALVAVPYSQLQAATEIVEKYKRGQPLPQPQRGVLN